MLSGWKLQVVLMCSIMSIWHLMLLILMLKWLYSSVSKTFSLNIQNLGIIHNLLFFISFTFAAIAGNTDYGGNIWRICYIIFALFVCLATLTLYLLLIFRLKLSFQNSALEISNIIIYTYYSILTIAFIICISGLICFSIQAYTMFICTISIGILLMLFTDIHIAYLFNHNLFKLVSSQRQSIYTSHDRSPSDNIPDSPSSVNSVNSKVQLSERQLTMIKVITKHTLTQTIGIIAFTVAIIISGFVTVLTINQQFEYGLIAFLWTIGIALIVTTYSIFVSFKSMENWYFKSCSKCDSLMHNCCIKLAENKIVKKDDIPDITLENPN
eukprot:147342_1